MNCLLDSQISRFVEGINNSALFSIVSLLLFILVFVGAVVWVLRLGKDFRSNMKNMPFSEDNNEKLNENGK